MNDAEQVSQALAELWDIVKCRCHEAYTGRGLHDPDCECDSTEAVKIVADRIEQLVATNEALTKERDEADDLAKAAFADGASNNIRLAETSYRVKWLEAKLAKAVEALGLADDALYEAEAILGGEYGDQYGPLCETMIKLRATLAEISSHNKGESHDPL